MTLECLRTEVQVSRRTSLVDVPSGAALAELRIPADRRGWVVVAHDGAHDPASAVADLNRNGLATLELRLDGTANAMRLVETVAWLKRSVAEAQGLPAGLLGFGAAASAALSAAAILGKQLGALVTVNASPDLAKARLNGVNTFALLIADAEHAGVNRRALQRVRGVSRLEIADGSLSEAARVYGAAWLSGHLGAAASSTGMLSRLVDSWRMPKLWFGAPSRAAAAFLLAAGAYFASAPGAQALESSFNAGVLSVSVLGSDSVTISASGGNVLVNGANPDSPGTAVSAGSVVLLNVIAGAGGNSLVDLAAINATTFPVLADVNVNTGDGDDTILGSELPDSLIGGLGNDSIVGGLGSDRIDGDDPANSLAGGNDTIVGDEPGSSTVGGNDTIGAGAGDDFVDGQAGDDFIRGDADSLTGGNDTLIGGLGNDSIEGMPGQDSITGGEGNDTLNGGGFSQNRDTDANTVDGGNGDDSILGGDGDDSLLGGAGNDTITGDDPLAQVTGSAHDSIDGGLGDDLLLGNHGNDTLFTTSGEADVVNGEDDDDILIVSGGTAIASVSGGNGANDTLQFVGTDGKDNLQVTSFGSSFETVEVLGMGNNDTLSSITPSATTNLILNGGAGNDQISGPSTGNFTAISLLGGDGRDTISGNFQSETIEGGDDIDSLMGGFGNDKIFGDNASDFHQPGGNDTLDGGDDDDTLSGGYGNDSILGGAGNDSIFGEKSGDSVGGTIATNDTIDGGAGNDSIEAGEGNDSILGGLDNDSICGDWFNDSRDEHAGNDTIDAGDGNDLVTGGSLDDSILGGDGTDSIFGGGGNDTIDGGTGDNTLFGEDGNDLLIGADGNELFVLGTGNDTALGGPGNDTFDDQAGGSDSMAGGTGDDSYFLKPGSDDIVGDIGGTDTLNFSSASLGVRMHLDKKGVRQSIDDNDNGLTLFGVFEAWTGSDHDDELELSPLVAPRTVDGGAHDSGDLLTYDAKGFGVTDNDTAGTLTPDSGGFGVVTYVNWETVVTTDSFDSDDIDGDSIPNNLDEDNDNDGIPDAKDPDKDGDGWDDDIELDEGTNPLNPTDFPDDSIVGASGADIDNDGIPNEIETAVGTDLDPSTAPGQMSVSKFTGKLKFPKVLKDALAFKTRLALPAGFDLDGASLIVDIGGVVREFDLDSKGKSDKLDKVNKAKLKLLPAKKQTLAGATLADLQVSLKKQDFNPELDDESLGGTASDLTSEHLVMLFVIVNDAPYKAVKKVFYKNKSGASGSFKSGKPLKELP